VFGILLIDKPAGITSHDVVDAVRRRFHTRRVGHAGTLDPLATGLLVVALGPATRFLQYLPLEPKEYVGDITFGRSTDSYDGEGETVQERPVPSDLPVRIAEEKTRFLGLVEQIPPMHSAVKVKGKPLYKYARQGQELVREPRTVHIQAFEILGVEGAVATVKVVCSGGTYVRTLAHDLGEAIGCGAFLSRLERTGVGRFRLDQAAPLDEVGPQNVLPLREALPPMPLVDLNAEQTGHVREGRAIGLLRPPTARLVGLLEPSGQVFSVARVDGQMLHPECVVPKEAFDGDV
jgi:tRNA pseudouridine55 synthase